MGRSSLKGKEAKALLSEISERYMLNHATFGSKPKIEISGEVNEGLVFINDLPLILMREGKPYPTLVFDEAVLKLSSIVVDMGAVPHVCNGADVMAPGIRGAKGVFQQGAVVVVTDERHGKPIAIGVSLVGSEEMGKLRGGKVVRNIHFVGDRFWRQIKG